jgi:hypothetical protein
LRDDDASGDQPQTVGAALCGCRRAPCARSHRPRGLTLRDGRRIRTAAGVVALSALLCPSALAALPTDGAGGVLAAWVELTTTGPAVRVVTEAASCPRAAVVDAPGAAPAAWSAPMATRAVPAPPDFPNLVCEWQPPPSARYVRIEGQPSALRMPAPNPRRIVVFGDSGCLGGADQDCAHDWHFPDITRLAAARQPDLVIHVGDINYRGTNCVAYDSCCTYNPVNCGFPNCGDSWATWWADFFAPAASLLATAPWVLARGNHELCGRAGLGWFRYLDPHSPPLTCSANPVLEPTYTAPYPLYLGSSLRLLMMDSADACGEWSEGNQIRTFREQFARLAEHAANGTATQTWLVTHKPLWGILRDTAARQTVLNFTLQQASANRLPPAISLVVSGHEHLFQSITLEEPGLPPALLVGTGGAVLDDPTQVPPLVEHLPVGPGGPTIRAAATVHDHGYLLMELSDSGWTATFHDIYDQTLATCDSSARPSVCSLGAGP